MASSAINSRLQRGGSSNLEEGSRVKALRRSSSVIDNITSFVTSSFREVAGIKADEESNGKKEKKKSRRKRKKKKIYYAPPSQWETAEGGMPGEGQGARHFAAAQ